MSDLRKDLTVQVSHFVLGELNFSQLRDWLAPVVWSCDEQCPDTAAVSLAHSIDLKIAEHLSGHRSIESLREELLSLVNPVTVYRVVEHGVPQHSSTRSTSMGAFQTVAFAS